jgi:acetate kinase
VALAGIGVVKDQSIGGLIFVLNSGLSSLRFAVYSLDATVEDPLLAGSASGIGRDDGKLEMQAAGGKALTHRESIHNHRAKL